MAVNQEKNKSKWTKDGRSWYFTYTHINDKGVKTRTKSKYYATKKEAKREEELHNLGKDTSKGFKRFDLIAEDYLKQLAKIRKESTCYSYIKDYNLHIKDFFGNMNIYTIDVPTIKIWASNMDNKALSVTYKNKVYCILKNIFDWAIKNYGLELNPAKMYGRFQKANSEIKKDKDKLRYITYEEFKKFIGVVDNPLYHAFFLTAYYTGCRKGELIALNWHDIDFKNDIISIDKTLYQEVKGKITITSNKTNTNRRIKMSKTLKEELLSYKELVKEYSDFSEDWFVFGNSIYLSTTTIDRYKKMYFKKAEVHEITMHEFRHSHVSLLINEYVKSNGQDMAKFFLMMSERLGHSTEVMKNTYMHLFPSVQDEIIDILDNL